jgi:hypothetical protein
MLSVVPITLKLARTHGRAWAVWRHFEEEEGMLMGVREGRVMVAMEVEDQ